MAKYFTYSEFIKSRKADKLGIDNTPTEEYIKDNIIDLMRVMDLVREEWTKYCKNNYLSNPQIIVNSGYRCETLNNAVGGSKTSAHRIGSAVDFESLNGRNGDLFKVTQQVLYNEGIRFDQLIAEKGNKDNPDWIHLGLKTQNNECRHQVKCL